MAIFDLLEPFITITTRSSLDTFQQVLVFLIRMSFEASFFNQVARKGGAMENNAHVFQEKI